MLLKKVKLAFAGAVCALFASCSSDSIQESVDYLPVQFKDGGRWSIVDSKGKVVVEDEFKYEPSVVLEGLFVAHDGNSSSLYNVKDVKKPVVEDIVSCGFFHEGVIPVTKKGERITLVDKKGKVKATLNSIGGKEIRSCAAYVSEGLLAVGDEDGNWGYVDKSGEMKIKPKYSSVNNFSEGMAVVSTDDKTQVIDTKGNVLFSLKEDYFLINKEFKDGKLLVRDREKECTGFVNKKGEFTKLNKVFGVYDYNSDYIAYVDDDYSCGFMTIKGETIIKPKYRSGQVLSDGNFFVVDEDGKSFVIDKNGEKKIEFDDYKEVTPIDNGHFAYIGRTRTKYAILNKKGEPVCDDEYYDISFRFDREHHVSSDYSEERAEITTEDVYAEVVEEVEEPTMASVDSEGDMDVHFTGSIGKYPIEMYVHLSPSDGEVIGKYRYTSSGSGDFLALIGYKDGYSLRMIEQNDAGEITGTFDGTFGYEAGDDTYVYSGKFINFKGTEFDFTLTGD